MMMIMMMMIMIMMMMIMMKVMMMVTMMMISMIMITMMMITMMMMMLTCFSSCVIESLFFDSGKQYDHLSEHQRNFCKCHQRTKIEDA